MRAFVFVVVSLGMISFSSGLEVDNWFDGLEEQDTNLLWCGTNINGMLMKFPGIPDCRPPQKTDNSTVVFVTTYWKDIGNYMVQGHECWGKYHLNVVTATVFGLATPLLVRQNERKLYLSRAQCLEMIRTKLTPDGHKLENLGPGLIGTDNNIVPSPGWFFDSEKENTNYYVQEIYMNINVESSKMEPIGTLTPVQCGIDSEHCATAKGMLVWTSTDHKTCRIMLGKTTPCLKSGQHITCTETFTSIDGWSEDSICGVSVAKSTSGILFSTNNTGELLPQIKSHNLILSEIHSKHENRINIGNQTDDGVLSPTQFGGHYDHITKIVADNIESVISTFHITDCNLNRMQLLMRINDARNGNVQGLLSGLIQDPEIRGELAGDVISIWRCATINIYYFLNNTMCTLEHPVKYLRGTESHEGWIRPLTKEIVDYPTKVPCPSRPFHFLTKDRKVLNLENRAFVEEMDTLPNPAAAVRPNTFQMRGFAPEAYFAPPNAGKKPITAAQVLNNLFILGETMENLMNGELPSDDAQWNILNAIGKFITALPFFSIEFIKLWLIYCGLGLLLLLVIYCSITYGSIKGVKKIFRKIGNGIHGVWKKIVVICCKSRLAKNTRIGNVASAPPPYGWQ